LGGVCAEVSGAMTLVGTALAGIPVSTTHTIAGAIVGVGASRRLSAVRWGVAGRIVWAWVLTIPAAALCAGLVYEVAGHLWPLLPLIAQVALGAVLTGLLVRAFAAWLQSTRTGHLAPTG